MNCHGEAAATLGESPVCCKVKLVLFLFYFFFLHLNFEVLFIYCVSKVSPLKQMLKALNGRDFEETVTLRTVCLAPLRKALQFSQKHVDLGVLSQNW